MLFSTVAIPIHISTNSGRVPFFPHACQHLLFVDFLRLKSIVDLDFLSVHLMSFFCSRNTG